MIQTNGRRTGNCAAALLCPGDGTRHAALPLATKQAPLPQGLTGRAQLVFLPGKGNFRFHRLRGEAAWGRNGRTVPDIRSKG